MPQAAFAASTFHPSRKFEELPLFVESAGPGKPTWRAGRVDIEAEISFDHTRDWWVSDLWIIADNGEIGAEAKGKAVNIHPRDHLWLMVLESIETLHRDRIEEELDGHFAALGFRTVPA